ncbi:MAG TPA: GNAT family N-acetyltransferase [Chthoniobacterales bacterium]
MSIPADLTLRMAGPDDAESVFRMVSALAAYERLTHEVTATPVDFKRLLADPRHPVEVVLAERAGTTVGFGLFFENFSTFLGKPGLYLEDLFVLPEHRRQGIGESLFAYLLALAQERCYGRMDWTVLDWNEPAVRFYTEKLGAKLLPEWRLCRITL